MSKTEIHRRRVSGIRSSTHSTCLKFLIVCLMAFLMAHPAHAEWDHFDPGTAIRRTLGRTEVEAPKPELLGPPSLQGVQLDKGEFDLNNATVMAYLSTIAYYKLPDEQGSPDMRRINEALSHWPGIQTVPLLAPPVQGFILKTADTAVVVIRGSDEIPDWIRNFQAVFPARKELGPKTYGRMSQLNPPELEPVTAKHRTHLGFQKLADLIYPQVHAALQGYEQKKIWFTGHSLGGAISTILNRDLHQKANFKQSGVYTFGAPMPGTVANANYFVTENIPAHRLEFNWDPVPTKPGGVSFRPVGALAHLREDSDGSCSIEVESFLQRKSRGLIAGIVLRPGDHSMIRYYNCLARIPR